LFDDIPDTPLEQVRMIENILLILQEPIIKPLLPSFVRTSRDLNHFWSYIKGQSGQWDPGGCVAGIATRWVIA
jgi:hypothetical protein